MIATNAAADNAAETEPPGQPSHNIRRDKENFKRFLNKKAKNHTMFSPEMDRIPQNVSIL